MELLVVFSSVLEGWIVVGNGASGLGSVSFRFDCSLLSLKCCVGEVRLSEVVPFMSRSVTVGSIVVGDGVSDVSWVSLVSEFTIVFDSVDVGGTVMGCGFGKEGGVSLAFEFMVLF